MMSMTDSCITTVEHLYGTTATSTSDASSGELMKYDNGTSLGSIYNSYNKFKCDGFENRIIKAYEQQPWNNNSITSDDCYMTKWMDRTNTATCYNDFVNSCGRVKWSSYGSGRGLTPQERLRKILQKRQSPLIITCRKTIDHTSDLREMRARETLRRVLGDNKFKSFITRGFVSVRAKSGLIYQIFPSHGVTAVYRDGEMIERLCVVLRGEFPPTDSLIMRYLLILNDERDFRKHAVKHTIIRKQAAPVVDDRSLTEIWKGLKVA